MQDESPILNEVLFSSTNIENPSENILSLETVLFSLNTTISDIQGLYPELQLFERSVSSLSQLYLVR